MNSISDAAMAADASSIVSLIRTSCHSCRSRSKISVNMEAVDRFLLDAAGRNASTNAPSLRLPLQFDSFVQEVNIISILALLNSLSFNRAPLHRITSHGSYSLLLSLLLSAHLSSSLILSTRAMKVATSQQIAALARIELMTEKPHPKLGRAVMVGEKDKEAYAIVDQISAVMKETGAILDEGGWDDLGSWMVQMLKETGGEVGKMLEKMSTTFPAFRDVHIIDGEPVCLFNKALFLLNAISSRFSPSSSADSESDTVEKVDFPLPNVDGLPIFVDNIVPSILIHLSILDLSESSDPELATYPISSSIVSTSPTFSTSSAALISPTGIAAESSTSPSPIPAPSLSAASATRLRAAALDAVSIIVARAHSLAISSSSSSSFSVLPLPTSSTSISTSHSDGTVAVEAAADGAESDRWMALLSERSLDTYFCTRASKGGEFGTIERWIGMESGVFF